MYHWLQFYGLNPDPICSLAEPDPITESRLLCICSTPSSPGSWRKGCQLSSTPAPSSGPQSGWAGAGFPGLQIKEGPSRPPLVGCLAPPAFPAGGGQYPLDHSASRRAVEGTIPGRGARQTPRDTGLLATAASETGSALCSLPFLAPGAGCPQQLLLGRPPQSDNTDPAAGSHLTGPPPSVRNDPRTPIATAPRPCRQHLAALGSSPLPPSCLFVCLF